MNRCPRRPSLSDVERLRAWNAGEPLRVEALPEPDDISYPAQDMDDYDDEPEPDEFEQAMSECGMTNDGFCILAGTEHCDWDCPIAEMTWRKTKRTKSHDS